MFVLKRRRKRKESMRKKQEKNSNSKMGEGNRLYEKSNNTKTKGRFLCEPKAFLLFVHKFTDKQASYIYTLMYLTLYINIYQNYSVYI